MKYIILIIIALIVTSCQKLKPKETIESDRNKKWYVEVIEGHEFLYRDVDRSVAYIHRPNCNACKNKEITINKETNNDY